MSGAVRTNHRIVADWTMVAGPGDLVADCEAFWRKKPTEAPEISPTALGNALRFGSQLMQTAPECWSKTIDVSGDGSQQ